MLRMLLGAVVVANLLFFGWARGWLGAAWPPPGHSQREPERLTAQIKPDRLLLLGPEAARKALAVPRNGAAPAAANGLDAAADGAANAGAASAANSAAPSNTGSGAEVAPTDTALQCLEAGPFTAEQLASAIRSLTRQGLDTATWAEMPLTTPAWLVFAGRFADAAARRTRLQAWQRQGVPAPDNLDAPRELAPGLVFSRHVNRNDAEAALAALAQRHPATANVARVLQAPANSARLVMLRVAAADAPLVQRLRDVALPQQDRFTRCSVG